MRTILNVAETNNKALRNDQTMGLLVHHKLLKTFLQILIDQTLSVCHIFYKNCTPYKFSMFEMNGQSGICTLLLLPASTKVCRICFHISVHSITFFFKQFSNDNSVTYHPVHALLLVRQFNKYNFS